jgi:hypothetical protein
MRLMPTRLFSYYRIHWPEMRIQELVDTINKLHREPTPDYKSVDGQARKDGLDFSICPTS